MQNYRLMKNKLFILLLLLFPALAFCQSGTRKLLHGLVISDTLEVERINVLNISSNIRAITDDNGNFTIYARPKDTLHFSSVSFRPAMLVLTQEHFEDATLLIRLEVNVTALEEVVVIPLTGDLAGDSRKTKTRQINSQFAGVKPEFPQPTTPLNTALPQTESQLQGVNFVEVYKMFFKSKKKKDTGEQYLQGKTFTDVVKGRYTYHFFTETLKIPHDDIGLFLVYCDNGTESALLLNPEKEFELTDYLVAKSKEYLEKVK